MRIIAHILGSRLDPEIAHRLHHLDHHGGVDVLTVASADIARRRQRGVTRGGEEIALALPREETLFDGAVLLLEADRAIVVRVGVERWLRLTAHTPGDALELGYHAGNLHWRVRFEDGALLVALEAPPEAYLDRLGRLVTEHRLTHSVVAPAAAPAC